jgi:hypothetical protein
MTNGQGGIDQISSDTWSTGWTHILSGSFTSFGNGLLFYNSHSGLTQVYGTDGRGSMQEISSTTLSMGWTHALAAGVLPDVGYPLLIFYNTSSGNVKYCQADSQGVVDQLTGDTWAKGWTEILYGTIPDVQQGNVIPSLLFYNGTSGTSQFYRLNVPGKIFQLSNTTWAKGWTEVLWLELP